VLAVVRDNLITHVASSLGSDGDLVFFISLGLTPNQYEEARKKYPDSFAQINMECLKVWCRTKARDATAVDKLKNALQEKERRDIIEKVEEIQSANEDCSE
jgi:hypothetical protein